MIRDSKGEEDLWQVRFWKMKLHIFIHDLDETRVSELIKFVDDKAVMGSSYKRQNKYSKWSQQTGMLSLNQQDEI